MQLTHKQVIPGVWYFAPANIPPDALDVIITEKKWKGEGWEKDYVVDGSWIMDNGRRLF